MINDLNLFWFGCLLWLISIGLIFSLFRSSSQSNVAEQFLTENEAALRQECLRLRAELQRQSDQSTVDFQSATFWQLQTLLTNYPSLRKMIEAKPDIPAKNLVSLLAPLDNLLASWKYEQIGSAWEQVPYNPQIHQSDTPDMAEGELVYIRFVGYRNGDRILAPAKVSRTLPLPPK